MKFSRTLIASALLASASAAQAELSANVAAVSNYLWRGVSQTGDSAAIQGGIDYSHESGFYAGGWASNIDFDGDDTFADTNGDGNLDTVISGNSKANVEIDLYAGFGGDIGDSGFGYDVGAIYYYYPGAGGDSQGGDLDFSEVTGSLSYGWVTGTVAYTFWGETSDDGPFQDGDLYYSASADLPFEYEGFASSVFIGRYTFDDDGETNVGDLDYTHWGISVSKDAGDFGSFSVNYEQTNEDQAVSTDENPNFWVGWAKDF